MTYLAYYLKLLKEIAEKEQLAQQRHSELKSSKREQLKKAQEAYLDIQNDIVLIKRKCDKVNKLITLGYVNANDEISMEIIVSPSMPNSPEQKKSS